MPKRVSGGRSHNRLMIFLSLLLLAIVGGTAVLVTQGGDELQQLVSPRAEFLTDASALPAKQFSLSTVPGWLFAHVGVIAALQVLALWWAARRALRYDKTREDVKLIQFLVEIPMYLGLFGTLLGVCLTQFIAGSLVAPLAYVTTMSGILLHVTGKLAILLPMPEYRGTSEE